MAQLPLAPLAPDPARARAARVAVSVVFALHGAVASSFATRIPWLRDHLDLGTGALGLALAFPALGSSVAMPLASRVMHRYGARASVRGLMALFAAVLALPALMPGLPALCVALLLSGATAGMADVAMNAQGVEVEKRLGRPIMSSLHGLWSVGALLGSAGGVLAVSLDIDARPHLAAVALLLTVVALLACRNLVDTRPEPGEEPPPRFTLPPRSALAIGAVGVCAILAEGASLDWSGVYLRDVAGASEAIAAVSFTAFACTMAAARLVGDAVVERLGPVRTVRGGGWLALAGGLLVVTAQEPVQAVSGFALLGVGIALVLPLAFAAAGRRGPNPSQAIAGVATVTYTAGLFAPTLIGTIGELTSLRMSFVLVSAATAVLVLGAGVLGPGGRSEPVAGDRARAGAARPAGGADR